MVAEADADMVSGSPHAATHAAPPAPTEVPQTQAEQRVSAASSGVRLGLQRLDDINFASELRRRALTLQSASTQLRGTLRFALRTGLEHAVAGAGPDDEARGWKLFFLAPRMLLHGDRSDADLSVQQQFCDEVLIRTAHKGPLVQAVYRHLRVRWMEGLGHVLRSWGPGLLDRPPRIGDGERLCHEHLRTAGDGAIVTRGQGNDADRVEFRFRDANNRLDLKCGRTSVPGTWLTVSWSGLDQHDPDMPEPARSR